MADFSETALKMIENIKKDTFAGYLGLEFLELDINHALARFPFKEELKNPYGTTHGGVLYSVADIVAGVCSCCDGYFYTTVSGTLNYLLPATSNDYIYLETEVIRRGKHLCVMDVKIKNDEGKLLDFGSFNFFKSDKAV